MKAIYCLQYAGKWQKTSKLQMQEYIIFRELHLDPNKKDIEFRDPFY